MPVALVVGSIALLLAVSGCGQSGGNEIVRIAIETGSPDEDRLVAVDGAVLDGRQTPLTAVLPLVPKDLPAGAVQDVGCRHTRTLTIEFAEADQKRTARAGFRRRSSSSLARSQPRLDSGPRRPRRQRRSREPSWQSDASSCGCSASSARPGSDMSRSGPRDDTCRKARYASTSSPGPSLRGGWEGSLLADRYVGEATRLHLRPPAQVLNDEGGHRASATARDTTTPNLAEVRHVLEAAKVRIVDLQRPAGALPITVRADDPAAFLLRHGERFLRALREPQPRMNVYFAVQDAHSSIVYAGGWLPSEGMMFARPDLDSCGPMTHGGGLGLTKPPCPA